MKSWACVYWQSLGSGKESQSMGDPVCRALCPRLGSGHVPTWSTQQPPSPKCTLETGREPVQRRRCQSELGQGFPMVGLLRPESTTPRRPQCPRGCSGPKANTEHLPEAGAALEYQYRGLSNARERQGACQIAILSLTSILLGHFTGGHL